MPPFDPTQFLSAAQNSAGGLLGSTRKVILTNLANVTVGNTVTETSLESPSFIGTDVIPANYFQAGDIMRIFATGTLGTDVTTPLTTLKLYYGATALHTVAVTPGAQITAGTPWSYEATMRVTKNGSTGSITASQFMWFNSTAVVALATTPVATTVDLTAAGAVQLKLTWGTANALNTATCWTYFLEVIG